MIPGAHGQKLSAATGVEVPAIDDVLPAPSTGKGNKTDSNTDPANTPNDLQRRFSKRGVRLGVHMSILDMGAHETTSGLRKRWLRQARSAQSSSESSHQKRMTTISEDGTMVPFPSLDDSSPLEEVPIRDFVQEALSQNNSGPPDSSTTPASKVSRRRTNSLKLLTSSAGNAVSRAFKRLSLGSKHENDKSGVPGGGEQGEAAVSSKEGTEETGWTKRLSDRLRKPSLSTHEWDEEFENGGLASMKTHF